MDALLDYVSRGELEELSGADRTTVARWKAGKARVPLAVLRLIEWRYGRHMAGLLGPQWSGWYWDRAGDLHAPGWRRPFTPGEILALPMLYAQLAALRRQLATRQSVRRPCRVARRMPYRRAVKP